MVTKNQILEWVTLTIGAAVFALVAGNITGCVSVPHAPDAPTEPAPKPDTDAEIRRIASSSACAKVSWKDRGRAPQGYMEGMALSFARNLCRYRGPETTVAGVIGGPIGSSDKDALVYYGIKTDGGEDRLIKTWALGIGLGMRESSGKYCEGRDMSVALSEMENPSIEAEAGTFQASYNSVSAERTRLGNLWAWYRANPDACGYKVWRQGVNGQHPSCQADPVGRGIGREWQKETRACPAFGAEWAMTLTRTLRKHFGPLNRKEAEFKPECVAMLSAVADVVVCE